jgi:hypothetical protein
MLLGAACTDDTVLALAAQLLDEPRPVAGVGSAVPSLSPKVFEENS